MRIHLPQRRRGTKEQVPDPRPPALETVKQVVAGKIRKGENNGKKEIVLEFQR
jgi:hypothetical protein